MEPGLPVKSAPTSPKMVEQVLAGQTRAVARMISRIEAGDEAFRPALAEIYRHTGRASVVGVTGVAGSGKSTLLSRLVPLMRKSGRTVAVIAVDPSSPFSGGSILGDRIRMNELAGDDGVFIRSMATHGALGGLTRSTHDVVDLLDAAGFDMVLVETVGAGQDEVEVMRVAHTVVVISAPGLGDDIQAIKAGLLEIADIHAVSKCDRPGARRTVADLKAMLTLVSSHPREGAWVVPVLSTSSETGEGVEELLAVIDRHGEHLKQTGAIAARRRAIAEIRLLKTAEYLFSSRLEKRRDGRMAELVERVAARELDPHTAATELLAELPGAWNDE